jgi:hypothetical protein
MLTAYDYVLDTSNDLAVPLIIKYNLIPCVHPQYSIGIFYHHFRGFLGILPITFLQEIPGHAQLAAHTSGYDLPIHVDDLGRGMRQDSPNCR